MSKRISVPDLRIRMQQIIDKERDFIQEMEGEENPQIVRLVHKAEGRKELADAVLEALNGFEPYLNSYADNYK